MCFWVCYEARSWLSLPRRLGSPLSNLDVKYFPLVGDAHRGFPQPGFAWLWLSPALASHPGI